MESYPSRSWHQSSLLMRLMTVHVHLNLMARTGTTTWCGLGSICAETNDSKAPPSTTLGFLRGIDSPASLFLLLIRQCETFKLTVGSVLPLLLRTLKETSMTGIRTMLIPT